MAQPEITIYVHGGIVYRVDGTDNYTIIDEDMEEDAPAMIDLETARQIAYSWHGGGGSPLYSFASTSNDGTARNVTPATVAEVDECLYVECEEDVIQPDTSEADLYDLRSFLTAHLPPEEEEEEEE